MRIPTQITQSPAPECLLKMVLQLQKKVVESYALVKKSAVLFLGLWILRNELLHKFYGDSEFESEDLLLENVEKIGHTIKL